MQGECAFPRYHENYREVSLTPFLRHDSVPMMWTQSAAISGLSWVALVLVVARLDRAAAGAPDPSNRGNSDAGGGRQMDSLLATSAILPGLIDKSHYIITTSLQAQISILNIAGYLALRMADIGGYMVSDIAYNITRMIITFMFLPSYLFSLTR